MQAGKFDRRVVVLRDGAASDDGYTTLPAAPATYATRWGWWKPATQRERFENAQNGARFEGTITLRSDTQTRAIAATDAVTVDGTTYDILGVSAVGRKDGVELLLAARV